MNAFVWGRLGWKFPGWQSVPDKTTAVQPTRLPARLSADVRLNGFSMRILVAEDEARVAARAPGTDLGLRIVRALAALHPGLAFTADAPAGRHVAELRWM